MSLNSVSAEFGFRPRWVFSVPCTGPSLRFPFCGNSIHADDNLGGWGDRTQMRGSQGRNALLSKGFYALTSRHGNSWYARRPLLLFSAVPKWAPRREAAVGTSQRSNERRRRTSVRGCGRAGERHRDHPHHLQRGVLWVGSPRKKKDDDPPYLPLPSSFHTLPLPPRLRLAEPPWGPDMWQSSGSAAYGAPKTGHRLFSNFTFSELSSSIASSLSQGFHSHHKDGISRIVC